MKYPITVYGDSILRKKAEVIEKDAEGLKEIIENMWETMYYADGVGLAAPQVTYIMQQLRQEGYDVRTDCLTLDEAEEDILRALGKGGHAV